MAGKNKDKPFEENKRPLSVNEPNLILCEGKDDEQFIIYYLRHLINKEEIDSCFLAREFGGKSKLNETLSALKNDPNYQYLKSLIIVRDADTNYTSAIQSVTKSLLDTGFPVPSKPNQIQIGKPSDSAQDVKVSFSLSPTLSENAENGTLEDLFLGSLRKEDANQTLEYIQCFMEYLEGKGRNFGSHRNKSKLHTYFSLEKKFVSSKVGEAAKYGAFNFDCEAMNSFKFLLQEISKDH